MTKCPDCERYKLSASVWRYKAYELAGKPLPWEPDELWVGLTDEDIRKAKTLLKDNDPEYAIFFIMTRLQEYNT